MKKLITILLSLIILSGCIPASVQAQFQPGHNEKKSLFTPMNIDYMNTQLSDKQTAYNQNLEYLNSIMTWILEIEAKSIDSTLYVKLEAYYAIGLEMYKEDLSGAAAVLDLMVLAIKKEIIAYNQRVQEYLNNQTEK